MTDSRPFAWYRPRGDQEPEFRTSPPPEGHGWLPVPGSTSSMQLSVKVDAASIANRFTGVERIVVDVMAERDRQDKQWGGPGHDDTHSGDEWLGYIAQQLAKAHHETMSDDATQVVDPEGYRQRLVKAAALAFAAIESHDRLQSMSEAFEGAEANLRSQGIPT